ncbi:MAG TPA: phage protein [Methylophilaceae bacterium]
MATYSFLDVNATLVGPTGVINLGNGAAIAEEGITIEPVGDKNTMMIGADGEGMHSLAADKSATVTVRLLKTSPTNAKLQAMFNAQTLSSSLHGQNVITVTQTKSGDVTVARECAFKRKPNLAYAKNGDIVEWVFDSIKVDTVLGEF